MASDKQVCVGYNSDCTGTAQQRINIYANKAGTVNLGCADCFVDFMMDVFVNVQIRGWSVANLSTGFRNMALNASTVIDANAQANWNTGIDKTLPVLQNKYLVDFKVGPVPFMVFFDLPVELVANFEFASAADASFGAHVNLGLGDAFVSWDPVKHWTHSVPKVKLDVQPVLSSTATLNAAGTFSVTPTLTAHFDRILSLVHLYTLKSIDTSLCTMLAIGTGIQPLSSPPLAMQCLHFCLSMPFTREVPSCSLSAIIAHLHAFGAPQISAHSKAGDGPHHQRIRRF